MMEFFMILYAAAIPVVPLIGVHIFKKRGQLGKQAICMALFGMQLLISGMAVYYKFFT